MVGIPQSQEAIYFAFKYQHVKKFGACRAVLSSVAFLLYACSMQYLLTGLEFTHSPLYMM